MVKEEQNIKNSWLSNQDIIKIVSARKGIKIGKPSEGCIYVFSESLEEIDLTDKLLEKLEKNGFKVLPPDREGDQCLLSLSVSSWRFKPGEKFVLNFGVQKNCAQNNGVHLIPAIDSVLWGNTGQDYLPGLRAFQVVAKNYPDAHPLIKETIEKGENFLNVGWEELGLEGLRSDYSLWEEFKKGGRYRERLEKLHILNPDPAPYHVGLVDHFIEKQWIRKEEQAGIIAGWERQVQEFKEGL